MIHVKWNRDVLHFPLPHPNTPLGQLRADLAAYTQLPGGSFKLVYAGAVMRDDSAPISAYKIKENATISLIGGHILDEKRSGNGVPPQPQPQRPPQPPGAQKPKAPQTEDGAIVAIHAELERVRTTLVPDVNAFILALSSSPLSPASASRSGEEGAVGSQSKPAPTPVDHTRLSELLLQSLLRLDALHIPGVDWPEARQERKAAVKEVQGVLDRLDGAWATRGR